MARLVLMQGLPASGKSTTAKALLREEGNAVRINRDLLRAMLHDSVWSWRKEAKTRAAARALAHLFLGNGTETVIIDDTNLFPDGIASWRQCAQDAGAQCDIIRLDTPLDECLRRDALRGDDQVGPHVIWGMALQAGLAPPPAKGYVLCDLDGTLADCAHRRHFLAQTPKDWDGFFGAIMGDPVRKDVLASVNALLDQSYQVFFVSGRPDTYRDVTELWLRVVCDMTKPVVFMRRAGDYRSDVVVKGEMLARYFPDTSAIHCVFDDRPSVIEGVWRKAGLSVIDCGTGEDF